MDYSRQYGGWGARARTRIIFWCNNVFERCNLRNSWAVASLAGHFKIEKKDFDWERGSRLWINRLWHFCQTQDSISYSPVFCVFYLFFFCFCCFIAMRLDLYCLCWFLSRFVCGTRRWWGCERRTPSSASIRSPSSKAANPWLLRPSRSLCSILSFDSFRCIINSLACPGAMMHFLGRRCQLSKNTKKKKKESKLKMLDSRRPLLIYDCSVVFFLSFIPTGHLVGSNRTAALDFVDISEQCVFVRSFWCVFVC